MFQSNLSQYLLQYTKACDESARPTSASLRLWATQLLSKKYRSGGEPLATQCRIRPARDLTLRSPAQEKNALPFDQVAGFPFVSISKIGKKTPNHQIDSDMSILEDQALGYSQK